MNERAMQVTGGLKTKLTGRPAGVLPRYLSMGSWHADLSREGQHRNPKRTKNSGKAATS